MSVCVTALLQWCYIGVPVVSQWCAVVCGGITLMIQWCDCGLMVMLQCP
jgi:hypothetical protein